MGYTAANVNNNHPNNLLSANEPRPFQVINHLSEKPILLNCEHASRRMPAALGDMGLDPFARRCHLAVDIGAGPLTEALAESLGVTAVVANYSRLVVDCNRQLLDPTAFLEYGDGIVVPGNRNLHQDEKDRRAEAIYWPYHNAVDDQVRRLSTMGPPPAFISIHSFTPVLNGESRPWQMGVLWDKDEEMRDLFLEGLSKGGYFVGSNLPYSGKAPMDFTIDHHAEEIGLPHVGIEIRQDLIDDEEGVAEVAELMHEIIESIPERIGLGPQRETA